MIIGIILGLSALLNIRLAFLVGKGYKWRNKTTDVRLDDENKILIINKNE